MSHKRAQAAITARDLPEKQSHFTLPYIRIALLACISRRYGIVLERALADDFGCFSY